jgi:glycosyltransferase involved in cell wall biosynthesis
MLTPFSYVTRKINRNPTDKLDVLSFSVHERCQSAWAETGHNFHLLVSKERPHKWSKEYAPIPENVKFLDTVVVGGPQSYDCVVAHTPEQTRGFANELHVTLGLPFISVEHCLASAMNPRRPYSRQYIEELASSDPSQWRVFITHYQAKDWGYKIDGYKNRVIYHGIDGDLFSSWNFKSHEKNVLWVGNDAVNRSYILGLDIARSACQDLNVFYVGKSNFPDGKKFSSAAKDVKHLVGLYQNSGVFLNTARLSSIPMCLLEAASVGMPIVTIDGPSVKEFFQDGISALICDDTQGINERLRWCLDNPDKADKMGQAARQVTQLKCSMDTHVFEWNKLFRECVNVRV